MRWYRQGPQAKIPQPKTKDKDRDATPTMGGTIDPVSDDDDTYDRTKASGAKGPGKGKGYKGGWRPLLDWLGRVAFKAEVGGTATTRYSAV